MNDGIRFLKFKQIIDFGKVYIRPLLILTKAELLAYLKQQKLAYRIDASNASMQFFRNKIRLNLIPRLSKEYNPQITDVLSDLAINAALDYDYKI